MAEAEAYLLAKFHLDPPIATVWLQYTDVTDRQTDRQTYRQDNGPIAQGEPFYKRLTKNG